MINIDKKEVYPVECKRCGNVSSYVVDEEMASAITYCVRCVTREQPKIVDANQKLIKELKNVELLRK